MALTDEQKEKYLKNPNTCPCCGSEDISGGSVQIDSNIAEQEVFCSECGEEWTDEYTLTGVR